MISSQAYQVRANRGRPRVWIEGKRLAAAGFTRGSRFNVVVKPTNQVLLKFLIADDGSRKVSGKGDRPIIDIVGTLLEQAGLKSGDDVVINYSPDVIEIEGAA
jgi:hypothetical protein